MFYGGRGDYFVTVDGQKAGLWQGFFVNLHGETRYGQAVTGADGTLVPTNLAMAVPRPDGSVTALTGVKFTQALSENFAVFFGKLNALDEYKQPLGLGGLTDGFLNTAFIFNPVYARTIPYSSFAAGAVVLSNLEPVLSVTVFDANDSPTTSGFDTFFDRGTVIIGTATLPVKPFCLPGHQGVSAVYSTRSYTDLDQSSFLILRSLIVPGVVARSVTGSWALTYQFDQMLVADRCNPKKGWGVFGSSGITDGNPNSIKWFASAGVGGSSPLAGRSNDTFGLGYFYAGLSDSVKELAPRLLTARDEHGVELFYNAAITPWCHITPDFQVVTPASARVDTAVIFGLRAKLEF
jgi:porin